MGSFSWNKADTLTDIENVVESMPFKFLIPKEFGGGYIEDNYQDFGLLGTKENGDPKYDMYELLAFWNYTERHNHLNYDGEYPKMKEIDLYTKDNRVAGVFLCYEGSERLLRYPLKLVSAEYLGSYEDLETYSVKDLDQGLYPRLRKPSVK